MFTKRNMAIMVVIAAQMVFSAYAAQQGSLRDLYQRLLQIQALNNPAMDVERLNRYECAPKWMLDEMLKNAARTGLIQQYKDLLATEKGSVILSSMFEAPCLRNAAFLQNMWGQGNPFKYNGSPSQADVVVGTYNSPNGMIIITRYSLINGLLEQADTAGAQLGNNQYFQQNRTMLRNNLIEAIQQAQAARPRR
jgi:hypothetical protein